LTLLLLYLSVFYYPVMGEIWKLEREISSFEKSLGIVGEMDLYSRNRELTDEKHALLEKTGSYLQTLPVEVSESDMIILLSDVGLEHAIKESILFMEPVEMDYYQINPIILKFKTNYKGLKIILRELDDIDACLSVSNIHLSSQGNLSEPIDSQRSSDVFDPGFDLRYNIAVEMTIYFFSQPQRAAK
jgi:hypothetical protein